MSKTILVVGFGPGISTGVAEKFGSEGFAVALVARNQERLKEGVKALEAKGIKAAAFVGDAGKPEAMRVVVQEAKAKLGPIHVVQWTAYGGGAGDLIAADDAETAGVFDVAITGLLATVRAALPDLKETKGAVLVTNGGLGKFDAQIDEVAASYGLMGLAMANSAKHKLVGMLSKKLAADGVHVGEVMVNATITGSAFDKGNGNLSGAKVADAFFKLYTERKDVLVEATPERIQTIR